ncbi:hypothetical protein T069G_00930 [Trichoderma breve]|uniref:Uncharacterized protein n=1 Tax=Trichoderma breve TaxID=2034170 RepID=A0A9W9ECY1_9HYPO|nr:hypothetical protein T069G_00930 [Trichoderma breve]KAJ4864400.1 hypothetical protein T069G_00930 [Trichoderma breve]
MAPPYVWTDPLQALALITENPARLSEELSSALSNPDEFETARQRAKTLVEDYQRVSPSDDTAPVLRLFLEKLPKEGQTALISDIITSENLRTLRDHLVDAILKPMKLAGGKQPVTAPSNPLLIEQIELAMTEIEPSYGNVMIMDNSLHAAFGEYSIGLWPMDEDNTYHIRSLDGIGLPSGIPTDREYVQFISHDHQLPLPAKDFLKTHYRIGEILQVSGIGRKIEDELDNSLDDPLNLRRDGSTDLWSILERKMLINV